MTILPREFLVRFLSYLRENEKNLTKNLMVQEKVHICKEFGIKRVPSNIAILTNLSREEIGYAKRFLLTKPARSSSGVTVIAIMTRPSRCPHGKCTYCPGGLGSPYGDVPQSYTGHEPSSMRGKRAGYDAYLQVFNRLEQYLVAGHDPQKIELIIMGGTFTNEDESYQEEFVTEAFRALNDFSEEFFDDGDERLLSLEKFKEFFLLPGEVGDEERTRIIQERIRELKRSREATLKEAQRANESARIRCIGLTIETRPDKAEIEDANRLLALGCTRLELGIQTTFDDVLEKLHRGHTVQDSIDAIARLRDLGFKLVFHLMLGLPGMDRERDLEAMHRIFEDEKFRPEMVKIYPCMVLPGTPLAKDYDEGRFTPITTEEATSLIVEIKSFVPRWCRIMRIQRDIPTNVTSGGVDKTNLRQIIKKKMRDEGVLCKCISCREIKERTIERAVLNVIAYRSSGGEEYFISIDDPTQDALLGFCRLRFPAQYLRKEFDVRTAIVRELHVYGKATGLGVVGIEGSAQHKGYGSQLLHVAERISRENGKRKLLVISGVGVRKYYEKLGYKREGPYMAKEL